MLGGGHHGQSQLSVGSSPQDKNSNYEAERKRRINAVSLVEVEFLARIQKTQATKERHQAQTFLLRRQCLKIKR
jgi:hypothetical protein